jgi:hypothetical protein
MREVEHGRMVVRASRLTAWFAVAAAARRWLGPVLRHWPQAREALKPH